MGPLPHDKHNLNFTWKALKWICCASNLTSFLDQDWIFIEIRQTIHAKRRNWIQVAALLQRLLQFFLIQLAEHVLPWHRHPLNLTIRSAYISGNLTLAFTRPILFQLWTTNLKVAFEIFYKGMLIFSLVILGLFSLSSRYSSTTLALGIAVRS